jgi:hypothetical protein
MEVPKEGDFMISLRTHNVLDYVIGAILVLSPWVFGFSELVDARNVFLVLGFGLIAYSLFTDYRFSIARVIPIGVHMALDVAAGIAVMMAPSVIGYRSYLTGGQYALHFVLGLGAVALVALTRTGRLDRLRDVTDDEVETIRRAA